MFQLADPATSAAPATKTWTLVEHPAGEEPVVRHNVEHDEFVALLAERIYGLRLERPQAADADEPLPIAA